MQPDLVALHREVVASLPGWVRWAGAPALALVCAVSLAVAVRLGHGVAYVVSGGLRVGPGAHWSRRARVDWMARGTTFAVAYLGLLAAIVAGQRWFGDVSQVPPTLAGLLAGAGALLGAWLAFPTSRSPSAVTLRAWPVPRRIRAWLAWLALKSQAVVLLPLIVLATPAPSAWCLVPAVLGVLASYAFAVAVLRRGYALGRVHPTPAALQVALDEACKAVGAGAARLVLAEMPAANAIAIRGGRCVVVSTLLVDLLSPAELHTLLCHEASHLTQRPRAGPAAIVQHLAPFFLPCAFVTQRVLGLALVVVWLLALTRAARATKDRERLADRDAHAADGHAYSAALWRIHEFEWIPVRGAAESHPDLLERAQAAAADGEGLELRAPSSAAVSLGVAVAILVAYGALETYRAGGADGTLRRAEWDMAVTGGARDDVKEWSYANWFDGRPAVARAAALLVHGRSADPYLLALAGLADIELGAADDGEARIETAVRIAREARWGDADVAALFEWIAAERR